eukprot:4955289-Pyramimonas_sp.AAC.1
MADRGRRVGVPGPQNRSSNKNHSAARMMGIQRWDEVGRSWAIYIYIYTRSTPQVRIRVRGQRGRRQSARL